LIKNHRREDIRNQVDASDHEVEVGFRCQELVVGTSEYEKVEEAKDNAYKAQDNVYLVVAYALPHADGDQGHDQEG
jgi:hypothetical protein